MTHITEEVSKEVLRDAFDRNFESQKEIGASFSLWEGDKEYVSFDWGTRDREGHTPWDASTLVLIWSATKGPAVACVLHALEEADISLHEPVASVWPEFGKNGKASISFAQLLSHQSGLSFLEGPPVSSLDRSDIIQRVENQSPAWEPGTRHGYSPRLFGFLLDEVVRRLHHGESLGSYWRRIFAEPLALDIWMGLPEELWDRVAPIYPPPLDKNASKDAFDHALADPHSLTFKAFANPTGSGAISAMNQPAWRKASIPSFGGIANARSLAKFYAHLATQSASSPSVSPSFFKAATTLFSEGMDSILQVPTAFSAGFMRNPSGMHRFGTSPRAFGHPGAGGSLAFADPDRGWGFAYVMNQMGTGAVPTGRAKTLLSTLYPINGARTFLSAN